MLIETIKQKKNQQHQKQIRSAEIDFVSKQTFQ